MATSSEGMIPFEPILDPAARAAQHKFQARIGAISLALVSLVGMLAFLSPFWSRIAGAAPTSEVYAAGDGALITMIVSGACIIVLFANLGPALSSKSVALLGVLVGTNAVLRLIDQSFLPPGEFSPLFLLIALTGYSFGAQLGFLMGALSLLASAFLTGGIGPWLPFQMLTAGWMGMSASWLRLIMPFPIGARPKLEIAILVIFSFGWGFLYGLIMNLYSWPLMTGATGMYFKPGDSLSVTLGHYAAFYIAQSLVADLARALGNVALMLILGLPLLRIFARFRARFSYQVYTPMS